MDVYGLMCAESKKELRYPPHYSNHSRNSSDSVRKPKPSFSQKRAKNKNLKAEKFKKF